VEFATVILCQQESGFQLVRCPEVGHIFRAFFEFLDSKMHNQRIAEENLWAFLAYFMLPMDYLDLQTNRGQSFWDVVNFVRCYYYNLQ
jgi:hypothetical protein